MRRFPSFACVPLLLAAVLSGQQAAVFHLPAGDHRLDELVARCEQAVKAPIVLGNIGNVDERRRAHLQCDVALPPEAWEDVLGSLLLAEGLVLTFDQQGKRHEVLVAPAGKEVPTWVAERARAFAASDFLARPSLQGPVRVVVPGLAKQFRMVSVLLRPLAMGMPGGLRVDRDADDLVLVGLGASVRTAMRTLVVADPLASTTLPLPSPRPWPRPSRPTQESLPVGVHALAAVVDCLARATGNNLLVDASLPSDLSFEVTKAIAGDADAIEAALTSLLWQHHVLVLGLAPAHGVYVVQQISPQRRPASGLAVAVHADEVIARPDLVGYVQVVYRARHVAPDKVASAAMAQLRAPKPIGTCEALGLPDGLLLWGTTRELRPVLERMQEVDRAP